MKNGREFQDAVRKINCLEREDFMDIFGKDHGAYIWDKFTEKFHHDVFELICYLDPMNIQSLFLYLTKEF